MDSSKCECCHEEKDLTACHKCYWDSVMRGIWESTRGDIVDRILEKIDERLEGIEEMIKTLFKDKQIVCIKRGKKLIALDKF